MLTLGIIILASVVVFMCPSTNADIRAMTWPMAFLNVAAIAGLVALILAHSCKGDSP